jgi:hypothetical protein
MNHHFILLTTINNIEVAVNVAAIADIYEEESYRMIQLVGLAGTVGPSDSFIRVKESLGDILELVGFAK